MQITKFAKPVDSETLGKRIKPLPKISIQKIRNTPSIVKSEVSGVEKEQTLLEKKLNFFVEKIASKQEGDLHNNASIMKDIFKRFSFTFDRDPEDLIAMLDKQKGGLLSIEKLRKELAAGALMDSDV